MASTAPQDRAPSRPKLTLVPSRKVDIELQQESIRRYRLWDPKRGEQLRWRYYQDKKRAHMGALIEARWADIGTTIEVIDIHNGKLLGQYTRRMNDIHFLGE